MQTLNEAAQDSVAHPSLPSIQTSSAAAQPILTTPRTPRASFIIYPPSYPLQSFNPSPNRAGIAVFGSCCSLSCFPKSKVFIPAVLPGCWEISTWGWEVQFSLFSPNSSSDHQGRQLSVLCGAGFWIPGRMKEQHGFVAS